MPQREEHLSVLRQVDSIVRHGWPQRVAADPLQSRPIPPWHDDRGMKIEPVLSRVT
jgi:hypothetical protein